MMTWTELSNQYFKWWQDAATQCYDMLGEQTSYLEGWGSLWDQSLHFKKMADQAVDEVWRNFRLPSREDVTRLHERLNLLESHLLELKEQNLAEEVGTRVLKKGQVASSEDLKPLRKSLDDMEKRVAGASELNRVAAGVADMEVKLNSLAGELEQVKELVTRSTSKLETLSAPPKRAAGRPPKRTSG